MIPESHQGVIESADIKNYWRYTGPQRVDKAMHMLEGILQGFASDGQVCKVERDSLRKWVSIHEDLRNRHPFSQAITTIESALGDDNITVEEADELFDLCQKFRTENDFFCVLSADIQKLHGILGGIAADQMLKREELDKLLSWSDEHAHLKGCWPYDEVQSAVVHALKDGVLDPNEHQQLMTLFTEFSGIHGQLATDLPLNDLIAPVTGFCAVDPDIEFDSKWFCFTGDFVTGTRKYMAELVQQLGGVFHPRVCNDLDYLVIGCMGNQSWAFACYGRKVQAAMELRKKGHKVILVHESDLRDRLRGLDLLR